MNGVDHHRGRCSINNNDEKKRRIKQGGNEKTIDKLYKETINVKKEK